MATRRRLFGAVTRQLRCLNPPLPSPKLQTLVLQPKLAPFTQCPPTNTFTARTSTNSLRCFSSRTTGYSRSDDDDKGEESDDEAEVDDSCEEEDGSEIGPKKLVERSGKTEEEKLKEAAAIGYTVIGPLTSSENPFKPYEPVFAVVQIGSHQFKVSNGDSIFTERLKYCEVNDKLILKKVLMMGSRTETIIGRPVLPDAIVHAIVEEHALDAKVIIFKKKRRKNYRRTKGHRQELTKLRIIDIQGIEKSNNLAVAS